MTPQTQSEPTLALYTIERELTELLFARDQAAEEGAPPAELEAIDQAIREYFSREVRKVDGICRAIHSFEAAAEAATEEGRRITARAKHLADQVVRIKAATLRAMQDHGVTRLETPLNKLQVRANGGKEPLESDIRQLQLAYVKRTITLNGPMMAVLALMLEQTEIDAPDARKAAADIASALLMAIPEPDNEAIRTALKQQVKCGNCGGLGTQCPAGPSDAPLETCEKCEGMGTVPATVPGAKLWPRGFHLRVE